MNKLDKSLQERMNQLIKNERLEEMKQKENELDDMVFQIFLAAYTAHVNRIHSANFQLSGQTIRELVDDSIRVAKIYESQIQMAKNYK